MELNIFVSLFWCKEREHLRATRWSQVWHNGVQDQLSFPFALLKAFVVSF